MVTFIGIWEADNMQAVIFIVRSAEEILYEVAVKLHALAVFVIEMVAHNNGIISGYSVSDAVLE